MSYRAKSPSNDSNWPMPDHFLGDRIESFEPQAALRDYSRNKYIPEGRLTGKQTVAEGQSVGLIVPQHMYRKPADNEPFTLGRHYPFDFKRDPISGQMLSEVKNKNQQLEIVYIDGTVEIIDGNFRTSSLNLSKIKTMRYLINDETK